MEAVGTMAGGIANDFNNLLAMIGTNAELGHSDLPEGHPVRKSFSEIANATARAKDIVKQILLFGRKQEGERKTIPLLPVIEDALKLLPPTSPATIQFLTA